MEPRMQYYRPCSWAGNSVLCLCSPFILLPLFALPQGGWNPAALAAMLAGVLPTIPGLLAAVGGLHGVHPTFLAIYDCAWFVGVAISTAVYCALMAGAKVAAGAESPGAGPAGGATKPA